MITLEFYPSEGNTSETVEWALNATTASMQNVQVTHRCPDVLARVGLPFTEAVSVGRPKHISVDTEAPKEFCLTTSVAPTNVTSLSSGGAEFARSLSNGKSSLRIVFVLYGQFDINGPRREGEVEG